MFRFFENLVDPYAHYEEVDHPPQSLWPYMFSMVGAFKGVFIWATVLSFVVAAVEIGLISGMGWVVDILSETSPDRLWQDHGAALMAFALFILILRPLFQFIDIALINNTIAPSVLGTFRWRTHRHVLRQSIGWFEDDFAGRISNRVSQTAPAATEVAFQIFDAVSYALAYIIGAAILLIAADARLLLPLLFWFAAYVALMVWVLRRVRPAAQASSDARSQFTGRIVDSYTNIHSVKMFAHHDREIAYAKEAIDATIDTHRNEMRLYSKMDLTLMVINGFLIVGMVGYALSLWTQSAASVGIVAAASALALRLSAMTGWIMWAVTNLFQNMGVVMEGMETVAQPVTLTDDTEARPLHVTKGEIKISDLSHHYGRGEGGLDHVDLTIQPGEKVGLIGRSGAGKSTLVKLLLRFYDAESGRIEIDGQDISGVTQDSLRSAIGMVQQDSALLHRSIKDNILYGNPDASDDQVRAAAEQAEASDFIDTLKDREGRPGYEAQVGERGVKLSGGQRQRISLARVILKDAPILVLDEATSALDSEVEAAIQRTLYGMMEGKTVIAIAHRLSTIAQMDRIVVLDEGRIIEQGSHEMLLAKGGIYARLWEHQSGGFIGAGAAE